MSVPSDSFSLINQSLHIRISVTTDEMNTAVPLYDGALDLEMVSLHKVKDDV